MSTTAKARQSKTNSTNISSANEGFNPSPKKQSRSRVSVEIGADLYETYKGHVQSRSIVQTTNALISLFCKNAKIREQVAKEIGVMAIKA